jgi:hypothetical protein
MKFADKLKNICQLLRVESMLVLSVDVDQVESLFHTKVVVREFRVSSSASGNDIRHCPLIAFGQSVVEDRIEQSRWILFCYLVSFLLAVVVPIGLRKLAVLESPTSDAQLLRFVAAPSGVLIGSLSPFVLFQLFDQFLPAFNVDAIARSNVLVSIYFRYKRTTPFGLYIYIYIYRFLTFACTTQATCWLPLLYCIAMPILSAVIIVLISLVHLCISFVHYFILKLFVSSSVCLAAFAHGWGFASRTMAIVAVRYETSLGTNWTFISSSRLCRIGRWFGHRRVFAQRSHCVAKHSMWILLRIERDCRNLCTLRFDPRWWRLHCRCWAMSLRKRRAIGSPALPICVR